MIKLSKTQQIEICNAINIAVAKGWTVNVEQDSGYPFTIEGAIIRNDDLVGITQLGNYCLKPEKRIFTTKQVVVEIDEIYKPPITDCAVSYPDLSNPSP